MGDIYGQQRRYDMEMKTYQEAQFVYEAIGATSSIELQDS